MPLKSTDRADGPSVTPLFSEAEVLNAARCAGLDEQQWLRLKAYLPVRANTKVLPIPPDQATRDQVAAVMLQHGTPAQQAEALASAAYEVVYFRRSPHESEDWLRVPAGTAKQHVREELITRIVPGELKPDQHPWLKA